jgi:hypothetical protein
MKAKLLVVGALMMFGTVANAAPAAAWELLGTRVVSDRMERDTIFVPGHARYRQIKLCVYRNPVRIYDLDVNFRNGGHQDVAVRSRINAGSCTRNIDLNGHRRDIKNIKLRYEETSWGRRHSATVRVFAR